LPQRDTHAMASTPCDAHDNARPRVNST
jgi:hypothetical protein